MADLVTLVSRLSEAEAALHRLMTGSQEEQLEHGDMRVAYTRADVSTLQSYIASLRVQVAAAGGTPGGVRRRAIVFDLP